MNGDQATVRDVRQALTHAMPQVCPQLKAADALTPWFRPPTTA
jgi:hypothetical protein